MADWQGKGLQNPLRRFESARNLKSNPSHRDGSSYHSRQQDEGRLLSYTVPRAEREIGPESARRERSPFPLLEELKTGEEPLPLKTSVGPG